MTTSEKTITEHLQGAIEDLMAKSHASTNSMYSRQFAVVQEQLKEDKEAHMVIREWMIRSDEIMRTISTNIESIKKHAMITNGRVGRLEVWKGIMLGGLGVLTLLAVPILAWALLTLSNIDVKIQASVDRALAAYNIE